MTMGDTMRYQYETIADIIELAQTESISFSEVVLRQEMAQYEKSREDVIREIQRRLQIFEESVQSGLDNIDRTQSGMSGGQAARLLGNTPRFMSELAYRAMTYAIAVNEANAKMYRIVACPTAGSCGVLPACLKAVGEAYTLPESAYIDGFLAAAGIGNVITERACVAGAVGGCQAEVGSAAAMAAGAVVAMMGGKPSTVGHALALCLKNVLGLVCDPVAGLVEVPCVKRNGVYAVHALTAAELSMMGIASQIPPDEVIEAMNEIGRALPSTLRETSEGGLAKTMHGELIAERIRNL